MFGIVGGVRVVRVREGFSNITSHKIAQLSLGYYLYTIEVPDTQHHSALTNSLLNLADFVGEGPYLSCGSSAFHCKTNPPSSAPSNPKP